jgi:hypothetical protein
MPNNTLHQADDVSWQSSMSDEMDLVYHNQATDPQLEKVVSIESKRLFRIGDEISQARDYWIENQFLTRDEQKTIFIGNVAKVVFNRVLPIGRTKPSTEHDLRNQESALGAMVFGELKKGETRREFCYDRRIGDRDSWIFYQEFGDDEVTLHYEVHPHGILRISSNPNVPNEFIAGQELDNFLTAAKMYHQTVMSQMYDFDSYSPSEKAV